MSEKVRRLFMTVLFVVFCISTISFGKSFLEYRKGDQIYDAANAFVVKTDSPVMAENAEVKEKEIDFSGLHEVNQDIIGWIEIKDTPVNYPLLAADDNRYYLNRAYDQQRSSYGSIFLEYRNRSDLQDKHLVIYGHNMKNGSMFGSLLEYKDQNFADNHQTIRIDTPEETFTYQVFSAYTAHVDSPTYRMSFDDEESYHEMMTYMKDQSIIQSASVPDASDQILTLSTCTPEGAKEYRFVVNAFLVENKNG